MADPDYLAFAQAVNPAAQQADAAKNFASIAALSANKDAGNAIAQGDYAAAGRALGGVGNLAGQQAALTKGGQIAGATALANRNYAGAAQAAGSIGDAAGVQSAQDISVQQFQLRHSYMQRATPVLEAAYQKAGPAGIAQAFDALTPDLTDPAIGFKPEQIAQFKQAAISNPQQFFSQSNAFAQRKIGYQKVGDNAVQPIFEDTGQPAGPMLKGPRDITVAPGSKVLSIDSSEQPGAYTGAGASAPGGLSGAIIGQESGGNPNAPTSVNGAVGQSQILPSTFAQYARPGEDINNPADNAAVGQRIVADLQQKYPGDPARAAVAYFSGPGNVAPAGSPTPWINDTKDGNGKSVSAYVGDIAQRMGGQQRAPGGVMVTDPNNGQPLNRVATQVENDQYNPGGTGRFNTATGEYSPVLKAGDIDLSSPQAREQAIAAWKATGEVPADFKGQGAEAAWNRAKNEAAAQDAAAGIAPIQRVQMQKVGKAAADSNAQLIPQINNLQAFERTANQNFDLVQQAAQKALQSSSGIKTVNEFRQWFQRQNGSDALADLDVKLNAAVGDYNKVVLGSGDGKGGAPGGQGERLDAHELFEASKPLHTLLAAIGAARPTMATRTQNLYQQYLINNKTLERGALDPAGFSGDQPAATAAPQQAPASPNVIRYDASGKRVQ